MKNLCADFPPGRRDSALIRAHGRLLRQAMAPFDQYRGGNKEPGIMNAGLSPKDGVNREKRKN